MTDYQADALVAGGTPGGIAAAVRAAREGRDVLLAARREHLGGMLASGINGYDTLYAGKRAPLVDEFRDRVLAHYRENYGEDSPQYAEASDGRLSFEPHVGEKTFDALVGEAGIETIRGVRPASVERTGRTLSAVTVEPVGGGEARRIEAGAFVDGTYEGDLAAAAGVPCRDGRESREAFDEPHAGRFFTRHDEGEYPREAAAGDLDLRTFGYVTAEVFAGSTGEGDGAVQAYNYRPCLTSDPDNRRRPEKPEGYDRSRYLGIVEDPETALAGEYALKDQYLTHSIDEIGFPEPRQGTLSRPNDKWAWNAANLIGAADDYPEGDPETRRAIEKRHRNHALGLLYFLQNDEAVPDELRAEARKWGLPRDEFEDNGNFPWQLYVREARRIEGRYVFAENDARLARGLERAPIHADAIAVAEWPLDSHGCRVERRTGSLNDGKFLLTEATRPSQVPYRTLLPEGLDNLLVPVALSATHVGWGTLRVEPTWMQIGEAAGFALALAAETGAAPADVDVDRLQRRLVDAGSMLTFCNRIDVAAGEPWVPAGQYLGTKGFFASYEARPDAPLTRRTARCWEQTVSDLLAGDLDPTVRARALPGPGRGEPITARAFAELLADATGAAVAVPDAPNEPIARGAACALAYEACSASP